MKIMCLAAAAVGLSISSLSAAAQAPAGAPGGSTGQCKDGSYSSAATKDGACRGHQGVKVWFAATGGASARTKPSEAPSSASPAAPAVKANAPNVTSGGPAPSGATGQCKDGTYSLAASKDGACRGHQGVKDWYAATKAAPAPASSAPATRTTTAGVTPAAATPTAPSPAPAPARTVPAAASPASSAAAPATTPATKPANSRAASTKTPAPGGGPGLVWVNTPTKVYHCPGSEFYGTTKQGKYMSEADAKASGARADDSKPCTR